MKRKIVVALYVAVLLLVFGKTGFAQEAGKLGIGARVSYVNYSGDDLNELDQAGQRINVDFDEGTMYGLNITYFFNKYFSTELSIDHTETEVDISGTWYGVAKTQNVGEITQIPVLLTGRLHIPINTSISPYVGAGMGYYFNDYDAKDDTDKSTADDSFGFHVNAGVEFFFAENYAINLDLKYVWNDVDFSCPGDPTEEISMDAFVAGIGLKYYF
jgi:outer membrane protein